MKMKYDISFWNYQPVGFRDEAEAVREWKDAGITLPMTFEYDPACHDRAKMLRLLDECEKAGMKAIVCDARTRYHRLRELGEKKFREEVAAAMKDFASHPAVFGFHVGDEPDKHNWEYAVSAYRIVGEAAPRLTPFLNMFPYWDGSFEEVVGPASPEEYTDLLTDFIRRSGAKILSFDSYGQCAYFDRGYNQECHLRNFKIFGEAAKRTGARLFVSLLSVGHWGYRVPSQDDIRWQIYSSVAHGATGFHWFSFYQARLDGNYRENPVNLFGERTQTFYNVSYEDRVFLKYFADVLSECTFEQVRYFGRPQGGFPVFGGDDTLREIRVIVNETSVAVTRWKDKDGDPAYTLVNMDRDLPTKVRLTFAGKLAPRNCDVWIVPGQMVYLDKEKMI